jgi:hypothetical protein
LWQFDIRTAFLNGELEEEVYMRPPMGAEGLAGGGSRVLHLKRALYGLRQASRAWNKRLKGELCGKDLCSQTWTQRFAFCLRKRVWCLLVLC